LNRVDLPTLGRPTMPIDRLTRASLVARGRRVARHEGGRYERGLPPVLLGSRHVTVTRDTYSPPAHKAWMSQPCRTSSMDVASTTYGPTLAGAGVTEVRFRAHGGMGGGVGGSGRGQNWARTGRGRRGLRRSGGASGRRTLQRLLQGCRAVRPGAVAVHRLGQRDQIYPVPSWSRWAGIPSAAAAARSGSGPSGSRSGLRPTWATSIVPGFAERTGRDAYPGRDGLAARLRR
jgi:hypothetical protein